MGDEEAGCLIVLAVALLLAFGGLAIVVWFLSNMFALAWGMLG